MDGRKPGFRRISDPIPAWLVTALASILAWSASAGDDIQFNRDIRPILSDKCFKCHGPDAKNARSEFRIDSLEAATKPLDGVTGIVPGKLKESEVHWRIHATDASEKMPPPKSKMSLTRDEIALLDRWIAEGAAYEQHWSLNPLPDEIPVPAVDGVSHPIDAFIRNELARRDLAPSPAATREKWLRRVTFDLTGLPPTIEELDAFLEDRSPDAFGKVVDRLLGSTAYAERMTAEWLDVARYSDTYGYQVDRNREVWPWRDWVIRAFEENLGYDQFITWQIAGDLLPGATREQVLATAFSRLHSQKVEGGSVEEEFRIEYVADRVHTFGTAFLGLTMECTRCHDHKYDPLTMEDYYSLSAFFANIDESGLYSFFTPSVPTPTLELPTEDQESKLAEAEKRISVLESGLESLQRNLTALPGDQALTFPEKPWPGLEVHLDFETLEKNKLKNLADEKNPASTNTNNRIVPGKVGNALLLTGDDAVNLPKGVGDFSRDQPFSYALWIRTPQLHERAVIVRRSKAWTDAASRGYELLLEDGRLSAALIHFWPGNAIRVRTKKPVAVNTWQHVAVTYDGSSRASGLRIFLDGEPADTEVIRDRLNREIRGGGDDFVGLGQRMRDRGFKNGGVDEFHVFSREITPLEIRFLFNPDTRVGEKAKLEFYLSVHHPPSVEKRKELRIAREKRSAIQKGIREIMVMRERTGNVRDSFILNRGMYDQPGEKVTANTPAALPPLGESKAATRLDLARWLTLPDHPLTARVTVNRYWQLMFGRGLVATPEDFGSQGKPPSHPELLDWLARDFIAHGWDLHHLLKQMALSETYRQSSRLTPELRKRDPENLWLARGPSHKLSAEMIRDNALAVSGLLSSRVGGPSVKPYDLEVSFKPIKPDKGENLHRRSVYTFWKRTGPSPLMMALDSSKKDVCRVKRERTDSPLQSLVLLNSPQFNEAARVTAARLLKKHGTDTGALIEESFRLLTSRRPDPKEHAILERLLAEQTRDFSGSPDRTRLFLGTGETPPPEDLSPPDLAAATVLISTLMNFDESISKR